MRDPDLDLVRRIARGDRRAAGDLVRRRLPQMLALARRMLGDAVEAEDAAQEVFLRCWKAAPSWREGGALFSTWMHRVAMNVCLDRLRRRREIPTDGAGESVADAAASPAAGLQARERALAVDEALARLPARQRAAIVLVHYQDLSNIDAAAALEVSVEALESLLSRGRRTLRAALAPVAQDLIGDPEGPRFSQG